jgi:hypothetical protein
MKEEMLDPTSIKARMKYGKPEDAGSIEASDESLVEMASRKIMQLASDAGMSRVAARKLGTAAGLAGEVAPGLGDINDIREIRASAEEGDALGTAVNSLALIPFVGNALKRGAEPSMELFRNADKAVQPRAFRMAAEELGRYPNPEKAEDVKVLVNKAAEVETSMKEVKLPPVEKRGNTPVSFGRDRDNPMQYHSTKPESVDSIEAEGLSPVLHKELKQFGASTSRDPVYSVRHFGGNRVANLFGVKLSDEQAAGMKNLSPREYDRMRESAGMDTYEVVEEGAGINLPKAPNFATEHESVVYNPSDAIVSRLATDDPEKAAFIQKGVDEALSVMDDLSNPETGLLADLEMLGEEGAQLDPAEARRLYTRIRDNMKQAAGLAKYTEDNSARGTYDWYIKNFAEGEYLQEGNPIGANANMDTVKVGLENLAESLGEQPAAEITRLVTTLDGYGDEFEAGAGAVEQATRTKVGKMASSVPDLMAQRKEEVLRINEELAKGAIDQGKYKKKMKALTKKYKILKNEVTKSDKEDPIGMMPTAERMAEGGLVSS